ncbi:hypothetical protein ES708_11147 [subsurface metagenome]
MSGKSQRSHRKLSKKEKGKRRLASLAKVSQQPMAAQEYEPAAPARVATPSANRPTSMPAPTAVQYPFVASEIRRISILAGIMLAILIILSLVLP